VIGSRYFKAYIKEAWWALDQSMLDSLILSMGRRLRAVRDVRGYDIKY
jgi:hypothetical protein